RSFLESAPDGVLVVDGTGQIALVNHQIEALFGYSRDELLGQPVEILVPERLRGRHVAHRDGFLARPATRPMGRGLELFGQRKDGTEFPVAISLSSVQAGGDTLATSIIRDVTQEKRAADELKAARQRAEEAAELKSTLGEIASDLQHAETLAIFGQRLLSRL